jgi:hypothetical protein
VVYGLAIGQLWNIELPYIGGFILLVWYDVLLLACVPVHGAGVRFDPCRVLLLCGGTEKLFLFTCADAVLWKNDMMYGILLCVLSLLVVLCFSWNAASFVFLKVLVCYGLLCCGKNFHYLDVCKVHCVCSFCTAR